MKYHLLLTLFPLFLFAQPKKEFTKRFQFSVAPAVGTNGMHPGGFTNYFSLNLTSNTSSANLAFEVAGISNLNIIETRGFQFAGVANVTGGNAFEKLSDKEIEKLIKQGFEANLAGVQISGATNIVLNNVFGWQATGGVNVSKGALFGFQLAGISNTVFRYSFGVQLAGLYNSSLQSMDGVQVASLFNFTNGGLYGVQVAMINRARSMEGRNSFEINDPSGVQIGLINIAGKMNGFQIGLINRAYRSQGTQVGLINIYRNGKIPETRDGTAIGLLNIGDYGHISLFANDLFLTNLEFATGTFKNRRKMGDKHDKYFENGLIYSNDPGFVDRSDRWAVGYGIKKLYFNRSLVPGYNHIYFYAFGVDWHHINHERRKWTKEVSLLTRPSLTIGSRLHPRNRNFFFFISAAGNIYFSKSGRMLGATSVEIEGKRSRLWPGFASGILIK
jgi:hypothetical protein